MAKNKYWKKGYKAFKAKQEKKENPYTLTPDIWSLLRKRTLWHMGFEEAQFTPTRKRLRKEAEMEEKRKQEEKKRKKDKKKAKKEKKDKDKKSRKNRKRKRHHSRKHDHE